MHKGFVTKVHGSPEIEFSIPLGFLCVGEHLHTVYCTVLYCLSAADLKLSLELKQL